MRSNLASHEIQWFMYYCDNLANYMGKLNNGQGMDLTLYKSVPKSLYIQVGEQSLRINTLLTNRYLIALRSSR